MKILILVFAFLVAPFAAENVRATEFEIGTFGATLKVPGEWKRTEFIPGMGKDQFVYKGKARLVVTEVPTPFFNVAFLRDTLETVLEGVGLAIKVVEASEPEVSLVNDNQAVSIRAEVIEAGVTLDYCLVTLGSSNLYYLLAGFCPIAHKGLLDEAMNGVRAGFNPGKTQQAEQELSFNWGRIRLRYPTPAWSVEDAEGTSAVFELEASPDTTAVYVFEYEGIADELRSATSDYFDRELDNYSVIALPERSILGRTGLEILGSYGEEGKETVRSLLIQAGPDRILELRMLAPHPQEISEQAWNILVDNLEMQVFPEAKAFELPGPKPGARKEAPSYSKPILEKADWLGTAPGVTAKGVVERDGEYVVYGRGGVQRVAADGQVEWYYERDTTIAAGTVFVGDGMILIRFGDKLWARDKAGEWSVPFEGQFARVRLVEGVLVAQRSQRTDVFGFLQLPPADNDRLQMIKGDGSTADLYGTPDLQLLWLVASGDSETALLCRRAVGLNGAAVRYDLEQLSALSADGKEVSLGTWDVHHIGPADGGWLVTGRPQGGVRGLYEVRAGTGPTLLLAGREWIGVKAKDSELIFAGPVYAPAKGATSGTGLYRVAYEVLAQYGAQSQPFQSAEINALGRDALRGAEGGVAGVFESKAAIRAFVARANERAEKSYGCPIARDSETLDALFKDWMSESSAFDASGIALLNALVAHALLEKGAEWVPGGVEGWGVPARAWASPANSYAFAVSPGATVSSTLFEDDGYWRPVAEVLEKADGRQILLGFDLEVLGRRVAEYSETKVMQLLAKPDVAGLSAHLQAHRANLYLRYEVYEVLASRSHFQDLIALSYPFAKVEEPAFFDLRSWLSGRLAAGEDAKALVADTLAAVQQFPRAPAIFEILGHAYLKRADDLDPRRARQCFERVLELQDSGVHADRANAKIAEIDAMPRAERSTPTPDF